MTSRYPGRFEMTTDTHSQFPRTPEPPTESLSRFASPYLPPRLPTSAEKITTLLDTHRWLKLHGDRKPPHH